MIDYDLMCRQAEALAGDSADWVPMMANVSAMIYDALPDLNWAGFYIVKDGVLLLGPFQGKVACVRIEKGKGVCGTAWEQDSVQLVPDVHAFSGHIACDSASNSEIVVPLHCGSEVAAVLDIDSPKFDRFSEDDRDGLVKLVQTLEKVLRWE
jgi:GAF domain-containing protein